jgi:anhydro-N-acetylmuramic acid kinase
VNIVLNELSKKLGKKYDDKGALSKRGKVNPILLKQLNSLTYYKQKPPKSLGKEWVLEYVFPLLKKSGLNPFDQLRTFSEHIAMQVANTILTNNSKAKKAASILITGGGTYNDFLIERIEFHSGIKIKVPEKKTIEFKEALIFAFLGVLRWRNEINCLKSVTGARKDNTCGCIYQ